MIGRDTGRRQTPSSKEGGLEQIFPSQASKEPTQLTPWFSTRNLQIYDTAYSCLSNLVGDTLWW